MEYRCPECGGVGETVVEITGLEGRIPTKEYEARNCQACGGRGVTTPMNLDPRPSKSELVPLAELDSPEEVVGKSVYRDSRENGLTLVGSCDTVEVVEEDILHADGAAVYAREGEWLLGGTVGDSGWLPTLARTVRARRTSTSTRERALSTTIPGGYRRRRRCLFLESRLFRCLSTALCDVVCLRVELHPTGGRQSKTAALPDLS